VHHNWFLTKVLDHVTPSFSLKAIPGLDASSFLDTLDLQNTISQLQNAGQDLLGFLQEIFADPGSFATLGIVDLLQAAQSLLLALVDLIGSLIKTFLSLIQTILAGIMDVLEDSVDIPLIGTLFEFLTGEDMDVLALGTLMIAVPLYLIYDILFDGLPFSGLGEPPAAGLGMSAAQQWANANLALGIVNWGASAVSDLITLAETPVVNPDEVPGIAPVISMFTNILALSMQIISWPDPNGFPFVSDESPSLAQIAVWFSWAVNWGPPLISYASKVVSDDAQAVIKTILGSAGMISGIVAAIEGLPSNVVTGAGAADLIVAPLSSVLAWLLVSAVRQEIWESSDLIFDPAYLIFVVDLIVNLAGPILNAISAAE